MWNNQHTKCLVSWLEDNIGDHQRLFSDLAQDAKEEHCCPCVAKNRKIIYHIKIAECIFAVDKSAKIRAPLVKASTGLDSMTCTKSELVAST